MYLPYDLLFMLYAGSIKQMVLIFSTRSTFAFLGIEQSVKVSHSVGEKPSSKGIERRAASISANWASYEAAMCREKSREVGSPAVWTFCFFQPC